MEWNYQWIGAWQHQAHRYYLSNDPFWPCFDLKFDLGNLDADGEAAETIKQAQSERARGIQNLQDQLKEAKMMQDKQDEQNLFEKVGIPGPSG